MRSTQPGLEVRDNEPDLPDVDIRLLPRAVKAELRGLPPELAEKVGPHVLAAGELIDIDPALAYRHALVARRLASRLPIVREAAAETAYAAGEFAAALSEYRALRRMNGGAEYLPVIADCERALGRPEEALKVAEQARAEGLDVTGAIEMRIVEAGARADLGQGAEARRLLKQQIQSAKNDRRVSGGEAARLRYAYADLLLAAGDAPAARDWFAAAASLDTEGVTDADDRVAELDGAGTTVIEFDDGEDEPQDTRDGGAESTGEKPTEQPAENRSGESRAGEMQGAEDEPSTDEDSVDHSSADDSSTGRASASDPERPADE